MAYHRCTWAAIAASLLFSDLPRVLAVPGCPAERTWTTMEDFGDPLGTRFRLQDPSNTPGKLELIAPPTVYQGAPYSEGPGLFPFVSIACLERGTVVRIDVNAPDKDTAIVGQYYSAPASRSRSPSRLAVDHYGNTWVVARQEADGGMGAVTRIALLIGGTRVNGAGQPSATGEYLLPPFDYCSVGNWKLLDRDDDDRIKTSYGLGLTLPWGSGNDNGGVSLAEDELIFSYTRIPGTNSQHGGSIAVDANSDVWSGGYDNTRFQRLSGAMAAPGTAAFIGSFANMMCGGYGALVDFDGVLWSSRWAGSGLRYDPLLPDSRVCRPQQWYGLGLNPITGNVWVSGGDVDTVTELDRNTGLPVMRYGQLGQLRQHTFQYVAKGVAVKAQQVTDPNTQVTRCESHVWIAGSQDGWDSITHFVPDPDNPQYNPNDPDNVFYKEMPLVTLPSLQSGSRALAGVSISTDGKIWVTDRDPINKVWVIDPYPADQASWDNYGNKVGKVDPRFPEGIPLGNGADPYTYPDFTGYGSRLAALHGTWTVTHDSEMEGAAWGTVSWNALGEQGCPADPEPGYTSLRVLVRAGDDEEDLETLPWREVENDTTLYGTIGRYIEIKVVFAGRLTCDGYLTPTLCDLTVKANFDPDEDCNENGVPDKCEIMAGDSADCNNNGIPDECELDCNGNGIPDDCDVFEGATDCNGNLVPDECEYNSEDETWVLYVDADAVGNNDGTSWADAYTELQSALAAAPTFVSPDCPFEIRVAEGTYRPDYNPSTEQHTGLRSATFQLLNGIPIYGGFAGYGAVNPNERLPQVYRTILGGDLAGNDVTTEFPNGSSYADNSYHVVVGSDADSTAVLDGVFIVSGNANYEHSYGTAKGGGVYMGLVIGSPRLINCVIANNWANREGASRC